MKTYPSMIFPIVGFLVAVVTWTVLSATQSRRDAPTERVIKITKTASEIAGEEQLGRGWWEQNQFDAFVKRHGWQNIRLEVKTTVGDSLQKYVASAVAGEAPDIVQLAPAEIAYWYDHGLLEPLDQYIQQWDDYREGHINKQVLDMARSTSGELLAIPYQIHGPAMYGIRRDWLERLQLKTPQTWQEAYKVWRAFTYDDPDGNGVNDTYGFVIDMRTGRGEHAGNIETFLFAAGVRWFRVDDLGRTRPAFNTPQAAQTLEMIRRAYQEGLFGQDVMVRTDEIGVVSRFLSLRNSGMVGHVHPDFYKSMALKHGMYDKVDLIAFLWKDEGFRDKGIYGTTTFFAGPRCMLKSSKDKPTAWKFFEYWLSYDAVSQAYSKRGNARERYLGRFGMYPGEAPWLPTRLDVESAVKIDPWIEKLARPLDKYIVPQPFVATWARISREVSEVFVDYYLNRYPSASAALDEAEQRSIQILEAYEKDLAGG